jgi:hypothetical protein
VVFLINKEVFMTVMPEVLTPQKILTLIQTLTRNDQQWIMRQLSHSLGQATAVLPVPTALEEILIFDDAERDHLRIKLGFRPRVDHFQNTRYSVN